MSRRSFLATVVAAFAATTFGPGMSLARATTRTPANHQVEISNFEFTPTTLEVTPGDTITWINRDIVPHTATADDESWDTGTIDKDESRSIVFEKGMPPSYFCRFHPSMKAHLRITAAEGGINGVGINGVRLD